MALQLYSSSGYNFTTENVKVLKGGWTIWENNNGTDPSTYPIEP